MVMLQDEIKKTLQAIGGLVFFRQAFTGPTLKRFKKVLQKCLSADQASAELYYSLVEQLIGLKEGFAPSKSDLFKNHLLNEILVAENTFSCLSEKTSYNSLSRLMVKVARRDLELLKIIYDFDLWRLENYIVALSKKSYHLPPLGALFLESGLNISYPAYYYQKREDLKKILINSLNWAKNVKDFHRYYQEAGSGMFARYWAFLWSSKPGGHVLLPVASPDPVKIEDLVGFEEQKKEVLRNTSQFVRASGANNMLLYGDRGTGKSSTIKSLVHIFGAQGLRIIEVLKHELFSLPKLVNQIRGRAQKFIIFIDDLSFEENETEYKGLKALLEGSINSVAQNILIYATSNRRNLVKEFFSDREPDEVGKQDTYQEKLSLADRFGIKLVYAAPGKEEYLRIVEHLAEINGVKAGTQQLHELALRWALWHNGYSGRTARQFITDLKGRTS